MSSVAVGRDTSYTLTTDLTDNSDYYWKVVATDLSGAIRESEGGYWKFRVNISNTSPNPFNPTTMVKYGLPEQSNIKIEIFNMLGQSVGVLVNGERAAGYYETTWNAANLPSGICLISIHAEGLDSKNNFSEVKKALLLK